MNKKIILIIFIWIFFLIIVFLNLWNKKTPKNIDFPDKNNEINITISWSIDDNINNQTGSLLNITWSIDEINKIEDKKEEKNENIYKKNIEIINTVWVNWNINICELVEDEKMKNKCFDNWYLYLASKEKGIDYCNKVEDINLKINCIDDINYENAINNLDKELCSKIINKNLKENCNSEITIVNVEKSNTPSNNDCNELNWNNNNYCLNVVNNKSNYNIFNEAIISKNIEKCIEIKDTNLKNTCMDTLYLEKWINEKNIWVCNLIKNIEIKEKCETSINKSKDNEIIKESIKTNNINLCKTIYSEDLKSQCNDSINLRLAVINKDEKKCELISNENIYKECLWYFNQ